MTELEACIEDENQQLWNRLRALREVHGLWAKLVGARENLKFWDERLAQAQGGLFAAGGNPDYEAISRQDADYPVPLLVL